jgi:hypothetical protein
MGDWIARVVRIRTTRDGGGHACGIVTGMGATPQLALAELRREAEGLAEQAGEEAKEAAGKAAQAAAGKADEEAAEAARRRAQDRAASVHPVPARSSGRPASALGFGVAPSSSGPRRVVPSSSGPREWRFEVVDVRLMPALMEGRGSGWLAYGTLAWEGHPPQASTTGAGSGSYGGSRGDRSGRGGRGDRGGRETR